MPPTIDFVPDVKNDEGAPGAIDFQPDQAAAAFAQSSLDSRPTFIPTLPPGEPNPKLEAAKEMALALPQAFGIGLGAVEKGVGAAIGQVAGTGDTLDDVRRAVEEGAPLPVELAAERARGVGGTLARVGLGLAETAPKIAAMSLFPGSILSQSIAAGGIFGLDAQGRFSPRAAAVGALLPGAGALAKGSIARMLAGAMERGTIGTMHPATQWITEEMGHQAALNTVMLVADSPELIELYHTDRDAFRRKIEDTIGMNLAFGLFGGFKRLRGAPTATQEYVRKNAEKFANIADRMITQQIVGGEGQQAIEKAIAEAKSRQKYAGFVPSLRPESGPEGEPKPPELILPPLQPEAQAQPPGFVPAVEPQLPPVEPKGPENAVQIRVPTLLPVGQASQAGAEVGGQVRKPKESAEARPAAETIAPPVEPKIVKNYQESIADNDPDALAYLAEYNAWAKRRVAAPNGEGGVRSPEQRALDDEAIERFGDDSNFPEIGWERRTKAGYRWNRQTKRFEKPSPVEPAKSVEPPPAAETEGTPPIFAGTPPPPKKSSIPIVIEVNGVQQPAYFEGYGTTATSLEPINPWISRLSDGGWTTGPITPDAKIVWGKIPEAPKPAEEKPPAEPAPKKPVEPAAQAKPPEATPKSPEAPSTKPTEAVKNPWEMTKAEFSENPVSIKGPDILPTMDWISAKLGGRKPIKEIAGEVGTIEFDRALQVANALRQGKVVPPEVLADYPDFTKPTAKPPTIDRTKTYTEKEAEDSGIASQLAREGWSFNLFDRKWSFKQTEPPKPPKPPVDLAPEKPTVQPAAPETGTVPSGGSTPTEGGKAPTGAPAVIPATVRSLTAEPGESPGRSAAAIRTDIRNAKAEIKRLSDIQKRLSRIGDKAEAAKRQRKIDALKEKLRQYKGELSFKTVVHRKREPGTLSEGITTEDGLLYEIVGRLGKVPIFMPDGIVMAQYKRLKSLSFRTPAQVEALSKILESFPQDFEGQFGPDGSIARAAWDAAKRAGIAGELFQPVKDGRRMMIDADFLEPLKRSQGIDFKTREFFEELKRLADAHYERTQGRSTDQAEGAAAEKEVKQGEALKHDLKTETKDTTVLLPEDVHDGTQFTLKGTKVKVIDLGLDEDGRLLWVMLDDGNKYGTQRVDLEDGRTELRMDVGSLKQPKGTETADEFLPPEAEPVLKAPAPKPKTPDVAAMSYDELVKAAYAGQEARRQLNDLPESIRNDAIAFFDSGLPRDGKTIMKWLEDERGTMGEVGRITSEIVRIQKLIAAQRLEAEATKELRRRENAPAKPAEKPAEPKLAPEPRPFVDEIKKTVTEDRYSLTANITSQQKDAGYTHRVKFKSGSQSYIALLRPEKRNVGARAMFNHPEQLDVFHESDQGLQRRLARIDFSEINAPKISESSGANPTPKPASEPKLSEREQKRLSDLQMKDQANRDAIGRGKLGDPLTPEEQREYEELTAKAGQRTLFDVDEVVAGTERATLEGQLKGLEAKLAEMKRQQLLSLTNAQNRQMGGDKAKEFMDAARTYEKRIGEVQNEIVDIKRKLRIGLSAEEYKAAPPEPEGALDLFGRPAPPKPVAPKPAEPAKPSQDAAREEIADIERKLTLLDAEWQDANAKRRKKKAMEIGGEITKLNERLNLLKSDLTEGQGEVVLRTPIAEDPNTGEMVSKEYRLRQMTSQEFMDYFKDPMQRMRDFGTVYTPWRAEMRRVYYDESGKETRHDPWYIDAIQKTREEAIEKAASYSGRSAEGWKQIRDTLNKPKGPEIKLDEDAVHNWDADYIQKYWADRLTESQKADVQNAFTAHHRKGESAKDLATKLNEKWAQEISLEQPSAPISAGKEGVSKGAGAAAKPVAGLTEAESARLAELTEKAEANEPMTKAERERFVELQKKAGARGGDERPEVRPGGDEPPANLGGGLEPGEGMQSEAEVRAAIAGEDTAGFPVKVITQGQAAEITGVAEARGYGGFFWKGNVYLVRENLSRDTKYREQVRQLLREEVGHGLLRTQAGRRLLSEVLDAGKLNLTDAERQKLLDMGYREHQLLDEFIAKSARENLPWWRQMVERARVMLSKLGLAKLNNEEVSRMLLRQIRAQVRKQAELERPSIRTQNGGLLRAPGLVEINPPVFPAIVAHHGTPHEVDRFRLDKVGTGEGAQVYGWGLYFAELKEVATRYREQLGAATALTGQLWKRITDRIRELYPGEGARGLAQDILGTPESRRRADFPKLTEEDAKLFTEYSRSKTGNEYTVTIEAKPDELLDWYKPINQQSQKVQDAVLRGDLAHANYRAATGAEIYNELSKIFKAPAKNLPDWVIESEMFRGDTMVGSDRQASQYLKSLGIKGIRYLDQGSRNAPDLRVTESTNGQFRVWDAGNGGWFTGDLGTREQAERWLADHPQHTPRRTYNYVIFDDSIIKITEQNGKPVKPSDVLPEAPSPSPAVGGGGSPLPGFDRMRSPRTKIKDLNPGDLIRFNGNLFAVDRVESDAVMKNEARLFLTNEQGSGSVTIGNKNDPLSNWEPINESVLQGAGPAKFREGPSPSPAVGRQPETPTPEGERPNGPKMGVTQVAGEKIGIERPREFIAGIRQRVRTGYFDGSQPVEPGRTEDAWQIAQTMVNPETKGTFASDLQRSGGGEMAPGLLRNELWDYAVRQAVRGDTRLMEFMVRRSQDFQTLAGEALADGDTALGRGLRAAKDRAFGGMWSRLIGFRNEQLAATGRRLQQGEAGLRQIIEAIDGLVANIGDIDAFERGLRTPEIQRIIDRTSDNGRAADEVVGNATFVPPERRSTILETVYQWMSREVDPQADRATFVDTLKAELQRLRLTPEQAQTIADATWNRKLTVDGVVRRRLWDKELRKLDNLAEKTADSFILSVDQAEWKRPEQPNEVRDIIKEALKSMAPLDPRNLLGFKRDLMQQLLTAGLSEEKARELARTITERRETDLINTQLRVRNQAAESKSLKSLVESLKASPYLAQSDPKWRFDTAVRWFESNGVPREQAQEAAKMFDAQFVNALTKAAEQAAKRLITKGDYGRNIPELIEAVRLGLTDPNKNWTDEIAKREGFRPLLPEAQQRLAELEQKYANPNLSAHEQVALVEQMMGIVRHAGDGKGRVMKIMGESFAASLLSGIRTMSLNWLQPWFTMLATGASHAAFEPRDFPTLVRSMWNASKNWWPEYKYAWSKDAYELSSEEQVFHSNALKTAFEEAQTDWAKGKYSQAILKFTYGWQQYVIRGLQSADQAGMVVAREWDMALYGSSAMREAGLKTSQITELVDIAAGFKRAEYERALYEGKSHNEAQVIANESTIDALTNFFENKLGSRQKAEAVKEAALYDAFNIVGRRAPGVEESDEGFLSRYSGLNRIMRFVSETRREGGGASMLTIMAVGFMNVPLRTARFYAGFGPYGILRWGIDKYRANRGYTENLWKQSYKNEYQSKARLREALIGTSLMLAFLGWQHRHHTSDEDAEKKAFAMYVTGSGPSNKTMRDAWLKRGFEPYALHVIADGKIRSKLPINRVGQILAFPLGLAASLDDLAWRRKQEQATSPGKKEFAGREIVAAMGTYYNIVGAQGVLQAFSHLSQMGQGQSGTGRAVGVSLASTASAALIPGKSLIQGVTDMITGPVDRSSVEAAIVANFPVVNALWNGQAINRFGDPVGDRTWSAKLTKLGFPILLRVSDTPENKALYQMILDKGAPPPDLRRYIVEDKYGPLSQDDWQKFVKISGSALKSEVLSNLDTLNSTDPHGVKLFMNRAADIANDQAAQALHLTPKPTFSSSSGSSGGSAVPTLPKSNVGLPSSARISVPGGASGGRISTGGGSRGYGGGFGPGTTGIRRGTTGRLSLSGFTGGQRRFVHGRLRVRSTRVSRLRRKSRVSIPRRSFRRRRISLRA